jgi:hypothetical protein
MELQNKPTGLLLLENSYYASRPVNNRAGFCKFEGMRLILTYCCSIASICGTFAQANLVPNGDFEALQACPSDSSQKYLASWYSANGDTPDHFTGLIPTACVCTPMQSWMIGSSNYLTWNGHGYQLPHSGQGYAGFYSSGYYFDTVSSGEYLAIRMADSLIAGHGYCVSFWVNNSSTSKYALDALGISFEQDSIWGGWPGLNCCSGSDVENISGNIISDTASWILVQDTFWAEGGEKFLVIGHLRANNVTNYLQIDMTYVGNQRLSYYFVDDVSVVHCDSTVGVKENYKSSVKFYPNPASNSVHFEFSSSSTRTIIFYDPYGKEMFRRETGDIIAEISLDEFPEGMYFFRITSSEGEVSTGKVLVQR